MLYQIIADCILLLHFAFIVFVVAGGMLVFKWRWLIWFHIPAAIWGAVVEIMGWICPLTPIENSLRQVGGGAVYSASFIEHYLVPVIYPMDLSREMFIAMGIAVIVINVIVYTFLFRQRKRN